MTDDPMRASRIARAMRRVLNKRIPRDAGYVLVVIDKNASALDTTLSREDVITVLDEQLKGLIAGNGHVEEEVDDLS